MTPSQILAVLALEALAAVIAYAIGHELGRRKGSDESDTAHEAALVETLQHLLATGQIRLGPNAQRVGGWRERGGEGRAS